MGSPLTTPGLNTTAQYLTKFMPFNAEDIPCTAPTKTAMGESLDELRASIVSAQKELQEAEALVKTKRMRIEVLQKQLQNQLKASVGGLKEPKPNEPVVSKPAAPIYEEARRALVRRRSSEEGVLQELESSKEAAQRWRVLGLKVKFGLSANLMAVKKRNLNDLNSFIDKETEEACKEDQLDLEGRCMRKTKDKRHFRRGGIMVGSTQGRDGF